MDTYIARLSLIPSARSPLSRDDYQSETIEDCFSGAHSDGFDYADYMADQVEWAKMVYDVAGTRLESYLYLAAARDYSEHFERCVNDGQEPLPRGMWCHAHVLGQIDRALEIADEI